MENTQIKLIFYFKNKKQKIWSFSTELAETTHLVGIYSREFCEIF